MSKVQLKDIASFSKGSQINGDDLVDNGAYDYLNGGINPSGKWTEYNVSGGSITISEGGNSCGFVNYMVNPFWCGAHCYYLFDLKCNKKYLYYALKSQQDRIMKLRSGACMPNIKKSDIGNFVFEFNEDINIQNKVVEVLDKVTRTIDLCNAILEKLDLLVKAKFVEMFGMVGTDRYGWGLQRIGNICEINPKKSNDTRINSELKVSFIPMSAVSEKGDIDLSEIKCYNDVKSGFTYFSENDVLFAKITPCMENGKGCVARNLCNGIGFGSTEFHVIRPTEKTNPYWLYTATVFKQFRQAALENMTGSAGQRRVPTKFLENYKIALPPIELQNQFAVFVAQTEKTKLKVKQALEKAETLKKALMQEYFG